MKAGWNKARRTPDRASGEREWVADQREGWVKLDPSALVLLDELITPDNFGSSATGYTETELAGLLGISVSALNSYLASNWAEHDIPAIFAGAQTVQFNGEGVLLCRDLAEEIWWCRLFTPGPNWKPGARATVEELERMFASSPGSNPALHQ